MASVIEASGAVGSGPGASDLIAGAHLLKADHPLFSEAYQFLMTEAELLDDRAERAWLEGMVSPEVTYTMPMRQTTYRTEGHGFLGQMYHLIESYGSLEIKVSRNETDCAWAEDPPSRARHFVSNVRVYSRPDDTIAVKSALLLYRMRGDDSVPTLLSGERQDVLRHEAGMLKLYRRVILLDHTVIAAHNLAIFF